MTTGTPELSIPADAPATAEGEPTPERIMQLGLGFWGSKTMLSAIELGVFTILAEAPLNGEELTRRLELHPRGARDFYDALVALGMLERNDGSYCNTSETDRFLDRNKPSYIGGLFEMANTRLYPFWGSLTEALRTGEPQNESKAGENPFDALYRDPERLGVFLRAMSGISKPAAQAMARKFPWEKYESMVDVGCAEGALPVEVLKQHAHLRGMGFDLPAVQSHFEQLVEANDLAGRLSFISGDFFKDPMPTADVIVMGHILHDWDQSTKMMLLRKAFDALPSGGAVVVYEALIDDERRSNAFGLLMSLNMLIETSGGFDYTGADCREWMHEAGFSHTHVDHLAGPDSMVVGVK